MSFKIYSGGKRDIQKFWFFPKTVIRFQYSVYFNIQYSYVSSLAFLSSSIFFNQRKNNFFSKMNSMSCRVLCAPTNIYLNIHKISGDYIHA